MPTPSTKSSPPRPSSAGPSASPRLPDFSQAKKLELDDALGRFRQMRDAYQAKRPSFNAFVYGFPGSYKTPLLATARAPVLLYQFDPGGVTSISEAVEEGRVIVVDFSKDDPGKPTAFRKWEQTFMDHQRSGLFEHVGTVAIDSLTTFVHAMTLKILAANGKPFTAGDVKVDRQKGSKGAPALDKQDYGTALNVLANYVGLLAAVPCDTILTAHAKEVTDEDTDRTTYEPMLAGQQKALVPLLFNEIYVTAVKTTPEGPQYNLHTRPFGRYAVCRSRITGPKGVRLDPIEKPNIQAILKKLGLDYKDLPF